MKRIFTLLLLCSFAPFLLAKPVSTETAKLVAGNFYTSYAAQSSFYKNGAEMKLVYTASSSAHSQKSLTKPVNYFYVYNAGENNGFVIVSADDNVTPVLGYSNEGSFAGSSLPSNVSKWFENYKSQIRDIIEKDIDATEEIKKEWNNLINQRTHGKKETNAVNPLVKTKWDQGLYYNALCPYDNSYGERVVTGCVATSMAQIMKFWGYPTQGTGFHSYNHDEYGTLSANFANTTYNWAAMTTSLNGHNTAVATLMYHAGVSVDMQYGVGEAGGSGAYVLGSNTPSAEHALENYFGYDKGLNGKERDFYTDNQWIQLLKTELDAGRPILYAGFGGGGGHAFVCDGYDNNNLFHFNWGWSGAYDGYFETDALNPDGVGAGGGSGGYNSGQQIIVGIKPANNNGGGGNVYNMELYANITLSKSTINYIETFTAHSNFLNNGTEDFTGYYAAALFDAAGELVDFLDSTLEQTLPAGYVYNGGIQFPTGGLVSAIPGKYKVQMLYKPKGGSWTLFKNGTYTNSAILTVVNKNSIELHAATKITPTVFEQGEAASVDIELSNFGAAAYKGTLDVSLYTLKGELAGQIEAKTNVGLCAGCHSTTPLTFSTDGLNVKPGTYILLISHKPTSVNGTGSWQFVGSSYYANPMKVIVKKADLKPDVFEDNDLVEKSYALEPAFTNDKAKFTTLGSNMHIGTDYDYYRLSMPGGFNYTINARVHDAENSDNGKVYTNDVIVSYSTDGINWSDTYDDLMPEDVISRGKTEMYFLVAPYFQGTTGTYLFDIDISRERNLSIENDLALADFKISPNPAADKLQLKLSKNTKVNSIKILDIAGKEILIFDNSIGNNGLATLPVNNLKEGVYMILVETQNGVWKDKFVKLK